MHRWPGAGYPEDMLWSRSVLILGALTVGVVALRRLLQERQARQRESAQRPPDTMSAPVSDTMSDPVPGATPDIIEVEAVPVGTDPAEVEVEAEAGAGDAAVDPREERDPRHAEDALWSRLRRDD